MAAVAVIGANYGDEGKGLMTDYFADQFGGDCLVIRFNGGAQAGHTVQTLSNQRHVFSHFGAGTLRGAPTFLSGEFVVNPMVFEKELSELHATCRSNISLSESVFIDEDCLVTTPYDMMMNRIIENTRGDRRHGSVGLGFGETIERSQYEEFRIRYRDLNSPEFLREKLCMIRETYVPMRLRLFGIDVETHKDSWVTKSKNISKMFKVLGKSMYDACSICDETILQKFKNHVFEGAQGLMLDQDYGTMPHVTRSNTGIKNVVTISERQGIMNVRPVYTTRTYLTRHGAGPLANELNSIPYPKVSDTTNLPGSFQGHLRFAYLDVNVLSKAILDDLKHSNAIISNHHLAITCCDQLDRLVKFYLDGQLIEAPLNVFVKEVLIRTDASTRYYESWGPTRGTVKSMDIDL